MASLTIDRLAYALADVVPSLPGVVVLLASSSLPLTARLPLAIGVSLVVLGTLISVLLIMTLPGWTKILAVVFMIVGSYFIATYMANVLVQNRAYRSGLEFFARGWSVYLHTREQGRLEDD